jgi:hypothetical protein
MNYRESELKNQRQHLLGINGTALVAVALTLSWGCSTAPKETPEQTLQAQYKETLQAAEEAWKQDEPGNSLQLLEKAAKLDPSRKQPWLYMANIHFDQRNYGPAITAAQEVQLRDNTDITAKTIIAASGVRVAAKAIEQLRAANVAVVNTVDEARALSRTMRDVLGEPLLPPTTEVSVGGRPALPSAAAAPAMPPRRLSGLPTAPQTSAAAAPPAPVVAPVPPPSPPPAAPVAARVAPRPAPAAAPAPSTAGRRNPFDVLVKD